VRPDDKLIQIPTSFFNLVASIAIVLMMLHVVADVFGRILFAHPLEGTTEIVSRFYMVLVIFLPLAYVCHHEGHIIVELFTKGLSRRRMAKLEVFIGLLTLGFVAWFWWESLVEAYLSYDANEIAETAEGFITVWPSRFLLPLGLGLMWLYTVYRLVEDLSVARGAPPYTERLR